MLDMTLLTPPIIKLGSFVVKSAPNDSNVSYIFDSTPVKSNPVEFSFKKLS